MFILYRKTTYNFRFLNVQVVKREVLKYKYNEIPTHGINSGVQEEGTDWRPERELLYPTRRKIMKV